jgi:hypothetical protein
LMDGIRHSDNSRNGLLTHFWAAANWRHLNWNTPVKYDLDHCLLGAKLNFRHNGNYGSAPVIYALSIRPSR